MTDSVNHQVATQYLTSLLNRTLRIHTSDTRIFVGQMKCTDRERNVILGMTHELRWPGGGLPQLEEESEHVVGDGDGKEVGRERSKQEMLRRFVGLVVVPGEFITRIEVE